MLASAANKLNAQPRTTELDGFLEELQRSAGFIVSIQGNKLTFAWVPDSVDPQITLDDLSVDDDTRSEDIQIIAFSEDEFAFTGTGQLSMGAGIETSTRFAYDYSKTAQSIAWRKTATARTGSINSAAKDSQTAFVWLHGQKYILNKVPSGAPVCPSACDEWTKGLVVIDDEMTAYEAKYWAESGAFVILDPPYMGSVKMGFDVASTYQDGRVDAQAFCVEIMRLCDRWCLFERPGSWLVRQAWERGAVEVERMHERRRQTADEIMLACAAYGAQAT